jgi:hypothetical protein
VVSSRTPHDELQPLQRMAPGAANRALQCLEWCAAAAAAAECRMCHYENSTRTQFLNVAALLKMQIQLATHPRISRRVQNLLLGQHVRTPVRCSAALADANA